MGLQLLSVAESDIDTIFVDEEKLSLDSKLESDFRLFQLIDCFY